MQVKKLRDFYKEFFDAPIEGNDAKVIGLETVDHPSDGQLVAYARKYFKAKDQMLQS